MGQRSIPQGLKAALLWPKDAKAKALAYLEAKTKAPISRTQSND